MGIVGDPEKKVFGRMILVRALFHSGFMLLYSYRLYLLQTTDFLKSPNLLSTLYSRPLLSHLSCDQGVILEPSFLCPPPHQPYEDSKPVEEKLCRSLLLTIKRSNNLAWQKPFKSGTPLHSLPRLLKVGGQLLACIFA